MVECYGALDHVFVENECESGPITIILTWLNRCENITAPPIMRRLSFAGPGVLWALGISGELVMGSAF